MQLGGCGRIYYWMILCIPLVTANINGSAGFADVCTGDGVYFIMNVSAGCGPWILFINGRPATTNGASGRTLQAQQILLM